MLRFPRLKPAGDRALSVEFGDAINEETNRRVLDLFADLQNQNLPGITEMVPAYRSLLVYYRPEIIKLPELKKRIRQSAVAGRKISPRKPRVFHIPVLYGGEYGPDLSFVASRHGISVEEVIGLHSGPLYRIYMLGFTPGFCYLGGMDPAIAVPRLDNPRTRIPAGSVGIAGRQTGIYPIDSPGGWRLIGSTPLKLFDPESSSPFLLNSGDFLRFARVDEKEYLDIKEKVERRSYCPPVEELES